MVLIAFCQADSVFVISLAGFVELTWDPLSSGQSRCLTDLCQRLQNDYHVFDGEQNKNTKVQILLANSDCYVPGMAVFMWSVS